MKVMQVLVQSECVAGTQWCGCHPDVMLGSPFEKEFITQLQGVPLANRLQLQGPWDSGNLSSQSHILTYGASLHIN